MAEAGIRAPGWKRFFAPILDFIMLFAIVGQGLAYLAGTRTNMGFELTGLPAIAFYAIVIVYFYVGRRVAGGTLWDRFFGIVRPQPRP